jgi:hypothetical protein
VARYRSNVHFEGRLVYSRLNLPGSPPQLEQYYVHQDHQGSIDKLSFGGAGPRFSVDAYGNRRNLDWTNDTSNSQFAANHWTEDGYTGHRHLDPVRMIHMNGRVQDPVWGRMISPDR